ncbi:uncharacterized protein [Cherax quadricarinatus]
MIQVCQHHQCLVAVLVTTLLTVSWAVPLDPNNVVAPQAPVASLSRPEGNLPVTIPQHSVLVKEITQTIPQHSVLVKEITQTIPQHSVLVKEITETTKDTSLINASEHAKVLKAPPESVKDSGVPEPPAVIRNNEILPCSNEGVFGIPNDCSFFYVCLDKSHQEIYSQYLYKCDPGYTYIETEKDCIFEGGCYSHLFGPVNDPGMPAPPSETPKVPEWFNSLPQWFNATPWWFKTPPSWFNTPPAWLNAPVKSQLATDHVDVEVGEIVQSDLTHDASEKFNKQITLGTNASLGGTSNTFYQDDKVLRIHIPIKIVQQ